MANCEYLRTIPGIIKCILICMITLTLVLSSLGTFNSEYLKNRQKFREIYEGDEVSLWREIYLLVTAGVCLIMSVANMGIHLASREIYWNRKTAIYDFFYHVGTFLLLSTSGVLYIVSAVRIFGINCTTENKCQNFELKFAAGGIAMLTSVFSGVIAAVVLTNRKDVERDVLYGDIK